MATIAKTSPRERLLRAAAELFYAEGVGAVGVERLCQTAGVSKRSMYQLFETKDELVAESLRMLGSQVKQHYFPPADSDLGPRERILYVFARLENDSLGVGFHGCPFLNTSIELHNPAQHASAVALEYKKDLERYFLTAAQQLDVRDTAALAAQLTVLFDGCAVRTTMRTEPLNGLALRTAGQLIDAAALSKA